MINQEKPLIFNIRSFALDDGPGIRTIVFMKGCNLNCTWCHNPESISPFPEIAFYINKCIGCGDCYQVCPEKAINLVDNKRVDREKCTLCEKCTTVCPTLAYDMIGRYYEPMDLVTKLLKDKTFYETSGGGITFSGGEPTLHMDYLHEVMSLLKKYGIHLALQTNGLFDLVAFKEKVLPFIDLLFFDLKIWDSEQHVAYTGKSNDIIFENFMSLMDAPGLTIIPRLPLVPGITDTEYNKNALQALVKSLELVFLPYNAAGKNKKMSLV